MDASQLVVGALVLGCVAGCGSGDTPKQVISGKVHVDDLTDVQSIPVDGHASHGCTVDSLAGKQVVITDPSGKKVGVVGLPRSGIDDPLPPETDEKFYGGAPGTCNLKFKLSVNGGPGIYTAEIEGMPGTSTSFSDVKRRGVVIEVKS
jgi:hypothetical protein